MHSSTAEPETREELDKGVRYFDCKGNSCDEKTSRPIDRTTSTSVTVCRWSPHARHGSVQCLSFIRAAAKLARQNNRTGWILVTIPDQVWTGVGSNPMSMLCDSTIYFNTSAIPRRELVHYSNARGLFQMDIQSGRSSRLDGSLIFSPIRIWIQDRTSNWNWAPSCQCIVTYGDRRRRHDTDRRKITIAVNDVTPKHGNK